MKTKILVYIAIVSLSSFNCFAQIVQVDPVKKKKTDNKINIKTETMMSTVKTVKNVKSYHVVETVNLKFGGHTTSYDVPDPKLINTYDLGPGNTRVVTIVEKKVEQNTEVETPVITSEEPKREVKTQTFAKVEPLNTIQAKSIDSLKNRLNTKVTIDSPKKMGDYEYIDVVKTYARVTEKGFKSIFMLKKVCNAYFFSDDFEKAVKCYAELFVLTTDLEPEYYYRYAISLKAMGEDKKASEYLKKFNQLSANKTK